MLISTLTTYLTKGGKSLSGSRSVVSDSLWPCGRQPSRLLCPRDFPGKNTGAGCHFLLQGIFPTKESNLGLPPCGQMLYRLSHKGIAKGGKGKSLSHVRLFTTSWTVACQAPLSLGFPRQEYWSGLPFPSPGDLPNPRIKPMSPALASGFCTTESLKKSESELLSCVWLFATPWTVAHQAPPSMGFSRQEYWSGLPFPSPGNLLDLGIEPRSPALQADALTSEPPGKPTEKSMDGSKKKTLIGTLSSWKQSSNP